MTVHVTSDPAEFAVTVFPLLERDPVLHTVLLSNVRERAVGAVVDRTPSVFVSVHGSAGEVLGAAMRTPGRGVFLGGLPEQLAVEVADAYAEMAPDAPLVSGTAAAGKAFAERWSELLGTSFTAARGSRLHRLVSLTDLPAPGHARPATPAEIPLAAEWIGGEFGGELGLPALDWARAQVEEEHLWMWEAGERPVSVVGHHDPVFGVSRVGPVYTPPEHRRRGYGGALTAHVTALILGRGEQACLYTDLANPTSNKIYAAIGYRPVADFLDYAFNPARSTRRE